MPGPRRRLLGDATWFQVVAGALAAMTAAFVAAQLGVTGTIVGAALGSLVATISAALYTRTLDHGRTLLVQTERGTIIEKHLEDGESVTEAFEEVADVASTPRGAQVVDERPGLHWRTIIVTSIVVLALALAAISTYELVVGREWGTNDKNSTTIGDTFGGGSSKDDEPDPSPSVPTTTPTTPIPTDVTPSPSPSPSATTPATPTPTDPSTASPTPE